MFQRKCKSSACRESIVMFDILNKCGIFTLSKRFVQNIEICTSSDAAMKLQDTSNKKQKRNMVNKITSND